MHFTIIHTHSVQETGATNDQSCEQVTYTEREAPNPRFKHTHSESLCHGDVL